MRLATTIAAFVAVATLLSGASTAAPVAASKCHSDAQCGISEYCGHEALCVSCEFYGNLKPLVNSSKPNCECSAHAACNLQRAGNRFSFCSRRRANGSPATVNGGVCRTCDECSGAATTFDGSACPAGCACATADRFCNVTTTGSFGRTFVGFCRNVSTAAAPSFKCAPCRDGAENQCTDATAAMPLRTCSDDCAAVVECNRNHSDCARSASGRVCTVAQQCKSCDRCSRFVAAVANNSIATSAAPMAGEAFDGNCPAGNTCCAWTVGLRPNNGADAVTFHSTCDTNGTVIVEGLYLVHPRSDAVPPVLSVMEARMNKCESVKVFVANQTHPVWRVHCPRIDRECLDTDYSFAVVRTHVASGNKTVLVWPQKGSNYYEGTDDDKCLNRKHLVVILALVIVIGAACLFVGIGMIYEKCHYSSKVKTMKQARLEAEEKKRQEEEAKEKKDNEPFFGRK